MFLTKDNQIKWKKIGLGALITAGLILGGIFWFDKPVFNFLRQGDARIWYWFDKIFSAQVWIFAALGAAVVFCVKKCVKTDCSFLKCRKSVNLSVFLRDFFEKTKTSNAFLILYSVFVTGVVVKVMKILIGRGRPIFYEALGMTGFVPFSTEWAFNSMPSGHAAVSFAGLVMIGMLAPRFKPLTWTLAILIGLSRVAYGAHWPTDVIFGAFIGMVVADIIKGKLSRS
ncbi:MAG: phosphatase PAP2 family protein [Alphaproteobacteria bacterium]|nr:phosphatase PAP2 family protein [Alphaproteobacteria bacterium]